MLKKISILSLVMILLLVACSPAEQVVESAEPEVMEEAVMEEADEAMVEESHDDEAMMEDEDHAVAVSFQGDVWPIIEEYALNAHGGKGGIFLENYDDIVAQVVPEDPGNSLLYKVLIGDGAPQMPPGNPLPDEKIQIIFDWIDQGALDN